VWGARLDAVPAPGLALLGLAFLNLMWGGSLPATKLALQSFPPMTLASARLVLATGLFVAALQPAALRSVPRKDALSMAVLGVIGFAGVQVFQALGTSLTSGSTATVLASTSPLWIAVFAPVLLHERPRAVSALGVLLALGGVALITTSTNGETGPGGSLAGNAIVCLSSVASALYTCLGKGLMQRYSPMVLCAFSCGGGALATLPLAGLELATVPAVPDPLGWALLLYLAVLVTFVGFAVWFWGLRALPAARAGALMFLQPLSGLLLATLVLGEQPTTGFLIGCGLVLAGVYVAARR
jgi:drug/metabolite transporter (DMT)-like permease